MAMNSFQVTVLREPGYAVLRTEGYINNLGAERIEQEIEPLIEQGCKRFIINFARSPIINSMGFSILIGIIERMLEIQGVLVFTNLTEVNAETMEIMGLTQYAHLLPTEEEARGIIAHATPPGAPAA
jgi:anti-anti-sigma factor